MGEGLAMNMHCKKRNRALAFACLGVLGTMVVGCASKNQEKGYFADTITQLPGMFRQKGVGKRVLPQVTRAQIDQVLNGPHIEVIWENQVLQSYLALEETRVDGVPGTITQWRSHDQATVALRSGVVIKTGGMGQDMLSNSVQLAAGVGGPIASGERRVEILAQDNKATRVSMTCELVSKGPDRIEVYDHGYDTIYLQESCAWSSSALMESGQITNEYWVSPARNDVIKSRQWVGPYIGYLRISQVLH
jgi:hypothetical protein